MFRWVNPAVIGSVPTVHGTSFRLFADLFYDS